MQLLLLPPLKLTSNNNDIQRLIANWLDEKDDKTKVSGSSSNHRLRPNFRSVECKKDLEQIESLRNRIFQYCSSSSRTNNTMETAVKAIDTFYNYHSVLVECESHGLCMDENSSPLRLEWSSSLLSLLNHNHTEIHSTFIWERANILWNIVSLETYQAHKLISEANNATSTVAAAPGASATTTTSGASRKATWSKIGMHLEKSAAIIRHLRIDVLGIKEDNSNTHNNKANHSNTPVSEVAVPTAAASAAVSSLSNASVGGSAATGCNFTSIDFSKDFLILWEYMLTANAQRAAYEAFKCSAPSRHFMLAKLAAAVNPILQVCEQISSTSEYLMTHIPKLNTQWSKDIKKNALLMKAVAQYHQACTHHHKGQYPLEHARLNFALRYTDTIITNYSENNTNDTNNGEIQDGEYIQNQINALIQDIEAQLELSRQKMAENNIPPNSVPQDLPEIPPQKQVNVHKPLHTILPPLQTPMFTNLMSPLARKYVNLFNTEMEKMIQDVSETAEEKTESARKALATVHLPHSLTAYKQEQAGGGIPQDLWMRVEAVQREQLVSKLKADLWELRDVAELARITYQHISNQLDEDLQMDSLFRQMHPTFNGHDAGEVQRTFRNSLQNYDRLLTTAHDGDTILLKRLELLDTDPKYKLLQFNKSQLDRLLPATTTDKKGIDTSILSSLLVELSTLFRERETLLEDMKQQFRDSDIHSKLAQVHIEQQQQQQSTEDSNSVNSNDGGKDERTLQQILVEAKESFNTIAYNIQDNFTRQRDLVRTILRENKNFMEARDSSRAPNVAAAASVTSVASASAASAASDSCISMIEDAIEEIDQLSEHLREGKDFYDVVIPKLEKLKQNVGDVSARLTVERCEYEDKARQNLQEQEDARMAASLSARQAEDNNNNSGGNNGNNTNSQNAQQNGSSDISDRLDRLQMQNDMGSDDNIHHSSSNVARAARSNTNDSSGADSTHGGSNSDNNYGSDAAGVASMNNQQHHQQQHLAHNPGVQAVSHDEPLRVRIDDEKVASLVAMDFDPDKVVAALQKYDNNVEHALNELLSC